MIMNMTYSLRIFITNKNILDKLVKQIELFRSKGKTGWNERKASMRGNTRKTKRRKWKRGRATRQGSKAKMWSKGWKQQKRGNGRRWGLSGKGRRMQNGLKRPPGRRQFGGKRRNGKERRQRGSRNLNGATSSCNCPCQQSPSNRTFAEKAEEFFSDAGHQNWEKAKLIFKGTSQEIWKAAKDYWKQILSELKDRAIKEGEEAFIGYLSKQKEATEAQNIFYEVAHTILTGEGTTVASEPSSVKRTFVEKATHLFSNFGNNILKHADQALSSAGTGIKKEAGQK